MYHKYGPGSKALRAHALDSKRWSKKDPFGAGQIGPPPFSGFSGVFRGSDTKSHPSPAVPELAPARLAYILSPINAGAWFHPKLLPPATCGSVKHPASMAQTRSFPGQKAFFWPRSVFLGGLTPSHTTPLPSLNWPLPVGHTSCLLSTQEPGPRDGGGRGRPRV